MINAFILAAGLGERLRPLTNHIPKPLLPILGRPMLGIILERLGRLNPQQIGINLHYKKEDILGFLNTDPLRERITVFYEDPILGTGGALKNAEGLLKNSRFIVHNSDILSDIDLKGAMESHLTMNAIATLIVHDRPEFNRLIVDDQGRLIGLDSQNLTGRTLPYFKRAFTGIAIYEPEFLRFIPEGQSSIVEAWLRAIDAGEIVSIIDVTGSYWTDIGKPSAYARAVFDALKREGEDLFVKDAINTDITLKGFVSIEGKCNFSQGVSLKNSIVIGRTALEGSYENSIIGPDFEIRLNVKDLFDFEDGLLPLGAGGSDRRYYRLTPSSQASVIIVKYPADDPDFERHFEYTRFFLRHNIPVPELLEVDYDNRTAKFEDLGDTSLYNWLKYKNDRGQVEMMYRRVLDVALTMHSELTEDISECPLLRERVFDFEHFRWETDYFLQRFVKVFFRGVSIGPSLLDELDRLAYRSDSYPKRIIHRDLQSRNILIKDGKPYIIDYQGARIGPPAYDIASILWDPYYRLPREVREGLLQYYIDRLSNTTTGLKTGVFLESLKYLRLQRHMQALGAYGFLSKIKGKGYFLKFVPGTLMMLKEEATMVKDEFPSLFELVLDLSTSDYEMFSL